jgi:hypothetical protein
MMKFVMVLMVVCLLFLGACSGTPAVTTTVSAPTVNPTTGAVITTTPPAATTTPTSTVAPTTAAPAPTQTPPTAPPTTKPTTRPTPTTPSAAYTGPLFDTHIHFDATTLSRFSNADGLVNFLAGGDVEWAVGFYLLPVSSATVTSAAGHIVPLFHESNWSQFFASESYAAGQLQQNLKPSGIYQGVGEIALYQTDLQSVTFNTAAMQTVFQKVNELKGVVMIHLSTLGMGGRATELSEVEPSVRDYPDCTFLFHGRKDDMKLVAQLMAEYSNVYFTIDANDSIFTSKLTGYNLLFPDGAVDDTAARFLADVKKLGVQALVQNGLDNLMTLLEAYPDKVMWGTDLSSTWHFDDDVFDTVINLSRAVIGQLPAELQEKYAYKNAQALFGRLLATTP